MKTTPEEFEKMMHKIVTADSDKHFMADELLCKVLKEYGYEKGIKIYEKLDKEYSY